MAELPSIAGFNWAVCQTTRRFAFNLKIVKYRFGIAWRYRKIPKLALFFVKMAIIVDLFGITPTRVNTLKGRLGLKIK